MALELPHTMGMATKEKKKEKGRKGERKRKEGRKEKEGREEGRNKEKLKIELPYDPAILLLGINPDKNIIKKDKCTPVIIAALITIAKTWKQPECPLTDVWLKIWYV